MNDNRGPTPGAIVAGIFLILFGLCITLVGGGCTFMWLGSLSSMGASDSTTFVPLLLISLVTLGAGLSLIWLAVKLMTGGFNK